LGRGRKPLFDFLQHGGGGVSTIDGEDIHSTTRNKFRGHMSTKVSEGKKEKWH
jgi:hypothetical protein